MVVHGYEFLQRGIVVKFVTTESDPIFGLPLESIEQFQRSNIKMNL